MKNKRPFSAGINIGSVSVVMIFRFSPDGICGAHADHLAKRKETRHKVGGRRAAVLRCGQRLRGKARRYQSARGEQRQRPEKNSGFPPRRGERSAKKRGLISQLWREYRQKPDAVRACCGGRRKVDVLRWEIVDTGDWNPDDGLNFQTIKY